MRVYTVTQLKSQCFRRTELSELKLHSTKTSY